MTLVPPVQFTVRPSAGDATLLMVSVPFGRLYGSTTTGSPTSRRSQGRLERPDLLSRALCCNAYDAVRLVVENANNIWHQFTTKEAQLGFHKSYARCRQNDLESHQSSARGVSNKWLKVRIPLHGFIKVKRYVAGLAIEEDLLAHWPLALVHEDDQGVPFSLSVTMWAKEDGRSEAAFAFLPR